MSSGNSTPPQAAGMKWIKEDIDKLGRDKADEKNVKLQFKTMKETTDRIRSLAVKAITKAEAPHVCNQLDTIGKIQESIEKIKDTLDNWKTVKVATIIAISLLVVSVIGNWYTLQHRTDTIERAQKSIVTNQETLKETVENSKKEKDQADEKQLEAIKNVVKDAITKNGYHG